MLSFISEAGGAVLLRALEPIEGEDVLRLNRTAKMNPTAKPVKKKDICNGPAKLCQAFVINKDNTNESNLCDGNSNLWLEDAAELDKKDIVVSKRIGIDKRGEKFANLPYRFYEKSNECVSVIDK